METIAVIKALLGFDSTKEAGVPAVTFGKEFFKLREDLRKYSVKLYHEPPRSKSMRKMLLVNARRQAQASITRVNAECNGLILDMVTLRPYVVPPLHFLTSPKTLTLQDALKKEVYEFVPIRDGTSISLYYDDTHAVEGATAWAPWRLATANGIDVSDLYWNRREYRTILAELLESAGIKPEDFYGALDKDWSYTVGFHHPDFHPFGDTPMAIWAICRGNRDTFAREYVDFAGLKGQEVIPPMPFKAMNQKVNESLAKYKETGEIDFGYILRPKAEFTYEALHKTDLTQETGILPVLYPPILICSMLYSAIKRLHYDHNTTEEARLLNIDRTRFNVLKAFISERSTFETLFPKYKDMLSVADKVTQTITARLQCMIDDKIKPEGGSSKRNCPGILVNNTPVVVLPSTMYAYSELLDTVCGIILADIHKTVNPASIRDNMDFLTSFICKPKYLYLLHRLHVMDGAPAVVPAGSSTPKRPMKTSYAKKAGTVATPRTAGTVATPRTAGTVATPRTPTQDARKAVAPNAPVRTAVINRRPALGIKPKKLWAEVPVAAPPGL